MAKAKATYTYNPVTGKREWHIEYKSDPDATAVEHARAHRKLVKALVGTTGNDDVDVDRGDGSKPEEKPAEQERHRHRERQTN